MKRYELIQHLERLDACMGAKLWVSATMTWPPHEMWKRCHRGDWMLWLASFAGVDSSVLVHAGCACVAPLLKLIPAEERRPAVVLEDARAWAYGKASRDVVDASWREMRDFEHNVRRATRLEVPVRDLSDVAQAVTDVVREIRQKGGAANAAAIVDRRFPETTAKIVRRHISWNTVSEALEAQIEHHGS